MRSFLDAQNGSAISAGGGTEPVWSPDGTALNYRNGRSVMKASIRAGEEAFLEPQELFEGPINFPEMGPILEGGSWFLQM